MKRIKHFLTIVLFVGLICFNGMTVEAKELEVCRLCKGSGEYLCSWCNNAGTVVCDGCGGAGGSKCQGDTYKGNSCDNGYYICKSCNGDGKKRTGDGDIVDGVCGNCNGAGQLRCVVCSTGNTPGWNACTGCEGDGISFCHSCSAAREIGYKCIKCTGTGYVLLANPMPPDEANDGIKNVPENGDHIVIDEEWHYYIYGQNSNGIFPVETVDSTMKPEPPTDGDSALSNKEEKTEVESVSQNDIIPDNRHSNYEIQPVMSDGTERNSYATIEVDKMSEEEQAYYTSLGEDELNRKLTNVRQILASAQPGIYEEGTEELINSIAVQNGYNTLEEGRIIPLYFEGHEDLGFPIAVRVYLEKGMLDGGTELYIYHICDNQKIEFLGKAEYCTYDDGSVESILFYTTGFSSFFTASSELNTIVPTVTDSSENISGVENNFDKVAENEAENRLGGIVAAKMYYIPWIVAVVVLLIFVIRMTIKKNIYVARKGKHIKERID